MYKYIELNQDRKRSGNLKFMVNRKWDIFIGLSEEIQVP
jgi:hypothetical protein